MATAFKWPLKATKLLKSPSSWEEGQKHFLFAPSNVALCICELWLMYDSHFYICEKNFVSKILSLQKFLKVPFFGLAKQTISFGMSKQKKSFWEQVWLKVVLFLRLLTAVIIIIKGLLFRSSKWPLWRVVGGTEGVLPRPFS